MTTTEPGPKLTDYFHERTKESEALLDRVEAAAGKAFDIVAIMWSDFDQEVEWSQGDTLHIKDQLRNIAEDCAQLRQFIEDRLPKDEEAVARRVKELNEGGRKS